MIQYNNQQYEEMRGNIADEYVASAKCVAQCTGCMCNCRCSCSGGSIAEFEWEEL